MSRYVTPDAESLGIRVTSATSVAKVAAALRRRYPDAPFADIKRMAEDIRWGTGKANPVPAAVTVDVAEVDAPIDDPRPAPKRRRPKTEAEASLVPVEGGEPIPAEPPTRW